MMSDLQLTFDELPVAKQFKLGYQYIYNGNLAEALRNFEEILLQNVEIEGLTDTIRIVKFWLHRWQNILNIKPGYKRADFLLKEWDKFENFIKDSNIQFKFGIISVKNFIFKKIIKNLIFSINESAVTDVSVFLKIGEILLEIDENKKAVEVLEYARGFKKNEAYIVFLLADAYARINEQEKSELLFIDAFLLNPQKLEINKCKSDVIKKLYKFTQKKGFFSFYILEWMPVYGLLYNFFTVIKNFTKQEVRKIIKEVKEFEKTIGTPIFDKNFSEPKLLYRYILLIDYYTIQKKNIEYIEIYRNKIKRLNPEIFNEYIKNLEQFQGS